MSVYAPESDGATGTDYRAPTATGRCARPTTSPVVEQLTRRIGADSINAVGAGPTAASLLEALQVVYQAGSSAYHRALDHALQVCIDAGEAIPQVELRQCLRQAVTAAGEQPSLEDALDTCAEQVLVVAHQAPRQGPGLFVMTVHQAKG